MIVSDIPGTTRDTVEELVRFGSVPARLTDTAGIRETEDRIEALGVAPDRIVICHSDVTPDRRYIRELLNAGVYVQLDNFGKEFTPRAGGFAAGAFAKDTERAELAARIIDSGFGDRLLLTNDVCLKCMLKSRGGAGYSHIFADIVPMIAALGVPEEYVRRHILHDNPVAMLRRRH